MNERYVFINDCGEVIDILEFGSALEARVRALHMAREHDCDVTVGLVFAVAKTNHTMLLMANHETELKAL